MNDPITLAATEYEEPRRLPDTPDVRPPDAVTDGRPLGPDSQAAPGPGPDPDPAPAVERDPYPEPHPAPAPDPGRPDASRTGAEPIRTVVETAATGRPVREVAALVSLLKDSGQLPHPGHAALRAAAVARPLHEVREMVTLLGEPPHEVADADITLRAAALGRPIEDVALLVSILGTGDQPAYPRPAGRPEPASPAPTAVHRPAAPARGPARQAGPAKGALRHVLRWPVALALLLCGALHVPGDLAALSSGDPGGLRALAVTLLCLTAGALLAVRDTAGAWRIGAVVALGVVALHVVGGVVGFDPLGGAVGGSVAWAGVTAVLSAATGAVLAGLALQYRPAAEPADGA